MHGGQNGPGDILQFEHLSKRSSRLNAYSRALRDTSKITIVGGFHFPKGIRKKVASFFHRQTDPKQNILRNRTSLDTGLDDVSQ